MSSKPTPAIDFLAPPQQPGELGRLGPYRVLQVLGKGGMGMVFRAEDPALQRSIALKVMLPDVAESRSARERFLREARAAAKIEHEHIIPIFQVGEDRGIPYIAMPFLKGMTVDDWIKKKGNFTVPQILRLGREIAKGLYAAHERGLIHRDIKPGNLWLDAMAQGRIRILDFGLARPVQDDDHLTQSGAVVGTPSYMSPEQARGEELDARSDLFSLGTVLYRLCTGRLPFRGQGVMAILTALATETPPPVRDFNPDVTPEFNDLIMRMLEKDPAKRPASARVVVDAILAMERERIRKKLLEENPGGNTFVAGQSQMVEPDPEKSSDSFIPTNDFRFDAATPTPAKPISTMPIWWMVAAGGMVLAVVGILSAVLMMGPRKTETAQPPPPPPPESTGWVEMALDSQLDKIRILQGAKQIALLTPEVSKAKIKIGAYKAQATDAKFLVEPELFEVTAEKNAKVKLVLKPEEKVEPKNPTGETSLFNGKDLTGWTPEGGKWSVDPTNGDLVGVNVEKANYNRLIHASAYRDFRISFEARVKRYDPKSVFGAELRFHLEGQGKPNGVLTLSSQPELLARLEGGDWKGLVAQSKEVRASIEANEFNRYELTVIGSQIVVKVNGIVAVEKSFPTIPTEGQFVWTISKNCSELRVRNVRFEDLTPRPENQLFNGKDLGIWKGEEKYWKVEGGEIVGRNVDRAEFAKLSHPKHCRDFRLSFQVRSELWDEAPGWGPALYFRSGAVALLLSSEPALLAHHIPGKRIRLAQQSADVRNAFEKPGYHHVELTALGQQITIRVDGLLAFDGTCPTIPEVGNFYWVLAKNTKELRIRDVRFEELNRVQSSAGKGPPWRPAFANQTGRVAPAFVGNMKTADFLWKERDGEPVLTGSGNGHVSINNPPSNAWKNFQLRFDYRFVDPSRGTATVGFFRRPVSFLNWWNGSDGKSTLSGFSKGTDWADPGEILAAKIVAKKGEPAYELRSHVHRSAKLTGGTNWNRLELTCLGNAVVQRINGQIVGIFANLRSKQPDGTFSPVDSGGLTMGAQDGDVEFRRIEVREINELPEELTWQPLFNGKDLTGWKVNDPRDTGKAEVITEAGQPVLQLTSRYGLNTDRYFRNYHFRCEYKVIKDGPGSGGVNLVFGNGIQIHTRLSRLTQAINPHLTFYGVGISGQEAKLQDGKLIPLERKIRGPDQEVWQWPNVVLDPSTPWQRFEAIRFGDSMIFLLNGKWVGAATNLRDVRKPDEIKPIGNAPINLWADAGTPQFRNLEIREITELPREVLAKAEWQSLFNGKDFTGWNREKAPAVGTEEIVTDNGTSVLRITSPSGLWHSPPYANYHLRFEYKHTPDAGGGIHGFQRVGYNFGLSFRKLFVQKAEVNGPHGSAANNVRFRKGKIEGGRVVGEGPVITNGERFPFTNVVLDSTTPWQRIEVIRWRNSLIHLVNGRIIGTIAELNTPDGQPDLDKTRFQIWSEGVNRPGIFRNVEIREISELPREAMEAASWQSLFNGKDLHGWKNATGGSLEKLMSVVEEDGGPVMKTAVAPPQALALTEKYYGNYHLRFEFKLADSKSRIGDQTNLTTKGSGMGLSMHTGGAGLQSWKAKFDVGTVKDGKIVGVRPAQFQGADRWWHSFDTAYLPKPGVWHRLEVFRLGDTCAYVLDGRLLGAIANYRILADGKTPTLVDRTPFALGTGTGQVSFRHIEIREIIELPAEVIAAASWQSLFNGKDLAGWVIPENLSPKQLAVVSRDEERAIAISDAPTKEIHTEAAFDKYHLRLQFKKEGTAPLSAGWTFILHRTEGLNLVTDGEKTIYLMRAEKSRYKQGRLQEGEVELGPESPDQRWFFQNAKFRPAGQWNDLEIVRLGDSGVVVFNGIQLGAFAGFRFSDGKEPSKTKIQVGVARGNLITRRIEIREITEFPKEIVAPSTWTSLLTGPGSPPAGWRISTAGAGSDGKFEAVQQDGEWLLRASGSRVGIYRNDLPRKDYRLRFEFRNVGSDTHNLTLKYHDQNGQGYSMVLEGPASKIKSRSAGYSKGDYGAELGEIIDGKILAKAPWRNLGQQPHYHPDGVAKKPGEWNQVELICLGDTSIQKVNGKIVAVFVKQRRNTEGGTEERITEGSWGIWTMGPNEIRRIEVREITEFPTEALRE